MNIDMNKLILLIVLISFYMVLTRDNVEGGIFGKIKDAAKDAANAVGDAAKEVGNFFNKDTANKVGGAAKDAANAVGGAAKDAANAVGDAAKEVGNFINPATGGHFNRKKYREANNVLDKEPRMKLLQR